MRFTSAWMLSVMARNGGRYAGFFGFSFELPISNGFWFYCYFWFSFKAVELQKLILAHNNIEALREDLRKLSSLVVLNISHNKLACIPAAIGE